MVYNPEKHHRRSIRLKGYNYSSEGWYFITLCTNNRIDLFGKIKKAVMELNEFGLIIESVWKKLSERYTIELDEYIIMPNHFHGIINIDEKKVRAIHESPQRSVKDKKVRRKMILPKLIGYFKMNTAKQINKIRNTSGVSVWQRNYFERIIRDEKELNRIRLYIQNNPGKWQDDKYYN